MYNVALHKNVIYNSCTDADPQLLSGTKYNIITLDNADATDDSGTLVRWLVDTADETV